MKRTATILLAVLGLLMTACSADDSTTEAGQQLDSGAVTDGDAGADDGDTSADGGDQSDADQDGADGQGDQSADGGSSGSQTLRTAVLGRALQQTDAMTSAAFEGVITMVGVPGSELPGEVEMTFTGAFDLSNDATKVSLDMGDLMAAAAASDPEAAGMEDLFGSMLGEPIEMIAIGDKSWVTWGLLAMFGVEEGKWLESAATTTDASFTSGFGFGGSGDSPTAMLEELADADATIEVIGQDDIRGVSTTHHRAELDMEALAAGMTPEDRAEFEAGLGTSPDGTYLLDLWVDGDDLLHRFHLQMTNLGSAGDAEFESMNMVYDIWAHGDDQGITPPPADQVITEAELGLSLNDLGGFGG